MVNGISGFGVSGYGNNMNTGSTGFNNMSGIGDSTGLSGTSKVNPSEELNSNGVHEPGGECQTCKNRKYQDGSDENVSFKAAAHISPEASAARVMGHEKEHVANAYTEASQKNGKVISAGVTLHMSRCPECGRMYVSGGVTRTLIKYDKEDDSNPYNQMKKAEDANMYTGINFDEES